jgi:hypothetical protein
MLFIGIRTLCLQLEWGKPAQTPHASREEEEDEEEEWAQVRQKSPAIRKRAIKKSCYGQKSLTSAGQVSGNAFGAFIHVGLQADLQAAFITCGPMLSISLLIQVN